LLGREGRAILRAILRLSLIAFAIAACPRFWATATILGAVFFGFPVFALLISTDGAGPLRPAFIIICAFHEAPEVSLGAPTYLGEALAVASLVSVWAVSETFQPVHTTLVFLTGVPGIFAVLLKALCGAAADTILGTFFW